VRITRAEFEEMIRPRLADTIGALRRTLKSADIEPGQLKGVLLVGGSSRIPLVAQTVSAALGRPVAVDAHPKNAVALGAALAASAASAATDVPLPAASATDNRGSGTPLMEEPEGAGGRPTVELVGVAPSAPVRPVRRLRAQAVVPFLLGLAVIGVGAYFLFGHHSSNKVSGSLSSSRHEVQQHASSGPLQHANGGQQIGGGGGSTGGGSTGGGSTGGGSTGGGSTGGGSTGGGQPPPPARPVVTAVNPSCAAGASGDQVTITGRGFTGATAVKFASTRANAIVHSDTWITALSPSGVTGTVDVTVSGPGGTSATTSNDTFIYPTIPSVTGVSPNNEGDVYQQALTITGGGFTCATSVHFGGLVGLNMQVNNDGSITVTPPPPPSGAGLPDTVDVTVTGPGGTSATSSSDQFTWMHVFTPP
jgi:hypothetical protein